MATLYTHKDSNIRKTWALMALFFAFVIGVGFVFSQVYGDPALLYAAVVFSVVMNVGAYWWSDKLVLAMARAKPIEKKDAPELYRVVENLCIAAGLPLPKIYVIDEPAPNAFATGRNPERAVVAVTTGLLRRLEKSELEGVIAHELSHIGNRDMLISTIAVVLVGFVALLSDWFLRFSFHGRGRREREGGGQIQGILALLGIILAILAPFIATLIRLAISRKREFLADADGALLTRYPEGLARALEKISGDPNQLSTANHATAHLYISNPFKNRGVGGFLTGLFQTHPPIAERLSALRRMEAE